jgi:hypothetical protein
MNEKTRELNTTGGGYRQQLKSYSGYYECTAELFSPVDKESLLNILTLAREQKRKVSFRGEGYSFDSQGLNNDLIISLKHFDKIEVNAPA